MNLIYCGAFHDSPVPHAACVCVCMYVCFFVLAKKNTKYILNLTAMNKTHHERVQCGTWYVFLGETPEQCYIFLHSHALYSTTLYTRLIYHLPSLEAMTFPRAVLCICCPQFTRPTRRSGTNQNCLAQKINS